MTPGELVWHRKVMFDAGYVERIGLVIGVGRPREGHFGCEENIKVFFSDEQNFAEVCDCELFPLKELDREARSAAA